MFVDRLLGVPYSEAEYDGIDVSRYNGVIKWEEVAENKNLKFVYVKATDGSGIEDRCYQKNIKGAKLDFHSLIQTKKNNLRKIEL